MDAILQWQTMPIGSTPAAMDADALAWCADSTQFPSVANLAAHYLSIPENLTM